MNNDALSAFDKELCQDQLLSIARRHVKLALEFGEPETSIKRREKIKLEIGKLREQRDRLLNHLIEQ